MARFDFTRLTPREWLGVGMRMYVDRRSAMQYLLVRAAMFEFTPLLDTADTQLAFYRELYSFLAGDTPIPQDPSDDDLQSLFRRLLS